MPAMPKEKTSAISLRESNFTELKLKEQLATSVAVNSVTAAAMVNSATGTTASTLAANNRLQQQKQNRSMCGCGASSVDVVDSSYNHQNYSAIYDNLPLAASVVSTGNAAVHSPKNLGCCRTKQQHNNGTIGNTAITNNETAATSNTNKLTSSVTPQKKTPNDFIFGKYIGEGSFSIVYLAVDVQTKKEYAIKVCEKRHILREHKQEYIRREREVMHIMTNVPGFVNLSCTFQDNRSLYFVMTYAKNGDLLPYINKVGSFDVDCTRHYAAELVLACEQMHRRNVVHRDLKPENILLDENMHILIADFGSSKILTPEEGALTMSEKLSASPTSSSMSQSNLESCKYEDEKFHDTGSDDNESSNRIPQRQRYCRRRKGSFVGTAQYVSPEVLQNGPITASADLWALGCIVYQMISGLPPFRGKNDYVIFKEILACDLEFPQGFNKNAEDLVRKLLTTEPGDRLGAQDKSGRYDSIRTHPFFECVDFDSIRQKTPPTIYPYLPSVTKEEDYRSHYLVPENLQPGLDDKQLTRLLGMELGTAMSVNTTMQNDIDIDKKTLTKNIFDISLKEKHLRLDQQKTDKWHVFADNEVILKKGYVNKRKGLFARKRMMLLTTGPRLIYIDPVQMVKKGEIPWNHELRVEAKNFKIFFVHTPNRTYYLEDPEGYSLQWVSAIENMRKLTYKDQVAMLGNKLTTPTTSAAKTCSS